MNSLFRTFSAVVITLLALSSASAQTIKTWVGGVSTGWNNGNNWLPLGVPSATDIALFSPAFQTSCVITSNSSIAAVQYDAGVNNFTLTSSAGISLSGLNSISVSAATTALQTINLANIATGSLLFPSGQNLTITNNMLSSSPGLLAIGPNTVIGTPGSGGVIFAGSGTTVYSGSFANNVSPNNQVQGGITKSGPGTLVLSGSLANVQGGFTFNGGLLQLDYSANTASKLPSAGSLNLMGGELQLVPHALSAVTQAAVGGTAFSAGHTDIRAIGSGAALALDLGPVTRSALGTLNVPATGMAVRTNTTNTNGLFGAGPAFATFGGTAWAGQSGSNLVSVFGSSMIGPGINHDQFSSQTFVTDITNSLRFTGNNATLTMNGTLTLQSGGILVPTGVTGSVITGGTVTTTGGAGEFLIHTYSPLTINSSLVTSAGLTKTGNSTLTLGGSNSNLTGPINVHRGGLRVTNLNAVGFASAINFTDNAARGDDAQTFAVELGDGFGGTVNRSIRFTAAANGPDIFPNTITTGASRGSAVLLSGVISSAPGTVTPLRIDGPADDSSRIDLLGANTFTGTVRLSNGTLGINANSSLGDPANRLQLDTGSFTAGGLEFLVGGIDLARPVEVLLAGRIVSNGQIANRISGPLSGSSLYKAGNGTLEVTGANSLASFFINDGTVRVNSAGLGASTLYQVFSQGVLSVTETATFGASRLLFLGENIATGFGTVDVGAAAIFTIDGRVTQNGVAGPAGLVKTGPGTLVLNNATNSYAGGTTVRAGVLQVGSDAALGTGAVTIEPLGTLRFALSTPTARTFTLLSGTIETLPGANLVMNGATVGGGFLRGAGTYLLSSGTTLTGVTTFTNTKLTVNGPTSISNFAHNGLLTVGSGQTLSMNYGTNGSAGRMTISGTANVTEFVSNGLLTVPNGGTLNNSASPSGIVLGGGSTTFVGTPAIPGGLINVGSQPMLVRGGLLVNNGAIGNGTGNGQVIVDYGGFAKGTGYYDSLPTTINGGKFSPGNSPGRVTVGSVNLGPGGIYDFEINNATGLAGPTGTTNLSGWDLTTVSNQINPFLSNLTVSATSATPFAINLLTLTDPAPFDVPGPMTNFNPNQPYSWLAFDVNPAGSVDNWDPSAIAINTSQFINEFNGTFSLVRDTGNPFQFYIAYTPVPEPASIVMATIGLGGIGWWGRRRARKLSATS